MVKIIVFRPVIKTSISLARNELLTKFQSLTSSTSQWLSNWNVQIIPFPVSVIPFPVLIGKFLKHNNFG